LHVLAFVALCGGAASRVGVFGRRGVALGVSSACLLALAPATPVTDGSELLTSLPRFVLVDFPLFIAGASLLRGGTTRRGATFGALTAVAAIACVAFSRSLWVS